MAEDHTSLLLFQLKAVGITPPELEVKFHKTRKWRFDLAWPDIRLAVEIHGAVYQQGRHTRGKGFTKDREKMNEAQLLGWLVLEVTPQHIKNGAALQWVEQAINRKNQDEKI